MKLFAPRTTSSFLTVPTPPDTAARVLRGIGLAIAPRVEHRLPGITTAFHDDAVVCADGEHVVGALGSCKAPFWEAEGQRFGKLTVALRHVQHQDSDPLGRARRIITTFVHEMGHVYTHATGIQGTEGPGRARHTEAFAEIAVRLGLRVLRRPEEETVVFTPGLSPWGEAMFADLITTVARARLDRTTGVGYAGPPSFHDLIPAPAETAPSSIFTAAHHNTTK